MAAKKVTPGSITQTADSQKDRINNISNVSRAINSMQKDVDQKIAETNKRVQRKEDVQQVQSAMTQTLGKVNQTIGALATGVTRITTETAKATAGAINQYGKAISQDISFNKKSVVAMALAKTSPIYGYFVSKFMETNVWKQALTKMKTAMMQTMSSIIRPFKGGSSGGGAQPSAAQGRYPGQGLGKAAAGSGGGGGGGGGGSLGGGGLSQLIQVQQEQLGYMRRTFGFEERYYKNFFERNTAMRLIRAFRRTKGNYSAQLSTSTRPITNIAHNVATLYTGLMWRMDNLLAIEKANAEANRDHATFVHKKTYPEIPGIRMKRLVKPLVRKLLGAGIKAMPWLAMAAAATGTGGLAGLAAGGVGGLGLLAKRGLKRREERKRLEAEEKGEEYKGPGWLTKRRGVYANHRPEGFLEGIKKNFRGMFPTGEGLEQRGAGLGGSSRRGGGVLGFSRNQKRSLVRQGFSLALGFSKLFGGRRGLRRPMWVAPIPGKLQKKYYAWSRTQDRIQSRALRQIRESNDDQLELQRASHRRAGRWRMTDWITKGVGWIGGIFSSITGFLTDMLTGALTSVFSDKVVLAAIGSMLGTYFITEALLDKFWAWWKTRDKRQRKLGVEVGDIREGWSNTAKTAPGARGYEAKARIELSKWDANKNLGDAKLNEIRRGQVDFITTHSSQYLEFPLDKISGWRSEWSKRTDDRLWFQDPYKYGETREKKFLNYLKWSKKSEKLSEKQKRQAMKTRETAITRINPNAFKEEQQRQMIYGAGPGYKSSESTKSKNSYEEIKRQARTHLKNKYGMKDSAQINNLLDSILPNAKISLFQNPSRMMNFIDSEMKKRNITPEHLPLDSSGSPHLFGLRVHDSTPGKINQGIMTKQKAEEIEQTKKIMVDPVVDAQDKTTKAVKDQGDKTNLTLNKQSIDTQNTIISSSSENISGGGGGDGGGGGGGMGRDDGWRQHSILSPAR